jgi:cell division protease FtsH
VNTGYEQAKNIILQNREALIRIAQALLEREVLDANELKMIIEGKQLPARVIPSKGGDDGVQQVLKPEPGRTPGILPGKPSPA